MKSHIRSFGYIFVVCGYFAHSGSIRAEEKLSGDAFNTDNIAQTVVTLRNLRDICSKYFKVNAEQATKFETVFLNTGNFGGEEKFQKQLKLASKNVKKRMASLGTEDWCKFKKTDYEAVNPDMFK